MSGLLKSRYKPYAPDPSFADPWQGPANHTQGYETTIWKEAEQVFGTCRESDLFPFSNLLVKNFHYLHSLTCKQGKYTITPTRNRFGVTNSIAG